MKLFQIAIFITTLFFSVSCSTMESIAFWKNDSSEDLSKENSTQSVVSSEVQRVVNDIPQIVGSVTWVDNNSPQAVIVLRQENTEEISFLLSRNEQGVVTALLESQNLQQGRSLAMTILQGEPRPGDWVTSLNGDVKSVIRKYFR